MTLTIYLTIVCPMKKGFKKLGQLFSGAISQELPTDIELRLTDQRMCLSAEQAGATFVMVGLVLLGFGFIFYDRVDNGLAVYLPAITGAYLLRVWLAHKFLGNPFTTMNQSRWLYSFSSLAALSGALWGTAAAYLIMLGNREVDLFLMFSIGALTAGAIPTLGVLSGAYFLYILGIMVPVAYAIFERNSDVSTMLGAISGAYTVYLIVTASNFRRRIDAWLRLTIENSELVNRLNEEKLLTNETVDKLIVQINERRLAEEAVEQHRVKLANLLGNLPGMAYRAINDGRWTIEYVSEGCKDLLGVSAAELEDQGKICLPDLLVKSDRRVPGESGRVSDDGTTFQLEYNLLTPTLIERRVIERGRRVFDEMGILVAIDGFVTDVSEQDRLSAKVIHLSNHDRLTGLPNRSQFESSVEDILRGKSSTQLTHTMLYIDIDQFKLVNDTSGHAAGDAVLRQVSDCLHHRLRRQDLMARLEGDEFGVLLVGCDVGEATRIANELCTTIEHHQFGYKDRSFWLSASIGLACTAPDPDSSQDLLDAADIAAYVAKANGGNRIHLYNQHDNLLQRYNEEMQLAIEIPEAIAEDRFYLVRQMIVPVEDHGSMETWYEVLLRLRDREGNVVMPGRFLPAAERYNLMILLDSWVFKALLTILESDSTLLDEPGLCFINISGQSMGDPGFLERICELLGHSSVPADRFCFEITETAAVPNMEQALGMIGRLQGMGCRFALDDFGSGMSSFRYLRDFPVEFIKIDGAFVQDMAQDTVNRSIVASINDIGHATGKKIIAEFVETDEVLEILQEIGVDFAQGYGIAMPVSFHGEGDNDITPDSITNNNA